jgi:short-subunit dehydrogenase
MMTANNPGKGKTALITGASAGIGKSFATCFAKKGFDLALVARRQDKLEDIAKSLTQQFGIQVHVLPADLSLLDAPNEIHSQLKAKCVTVDVLINNAGYALNKPFTKASWSEHQAFINVMMNAVTQLCYLFGTEMKDRGYGRILNVASVAAFSPEWAGSLYGAVKAYVTHFSEAIDLELKPYNVYCTALCPGFTRSEFHDAMGARKAMDKLPGWLWMDAEQVAEQGYEALMKGEPAYINGWVNKSIVTAFQLMPRKLKYLISAKQKLM